MAQSSWIRAAGWEFRLGMQAAPFPAGLRWAFPPANTPRARLENSPCTEQGWGLVLPARAGQEGLDHTSRSKVCQKLTCPCTAGLERHGRREGKTKGENKGGARLAPA